MENEFHAWLRSRTPSSDQVVLPIGDDAAMLALPPGELLVVAADTVMDGVHFLLDRHGGAAAGRKALAVNLSDLAAMAAVPCAATVALTLPRNNADSLARDVLEGVLQLADSFELTVCGGDTNCWDHPLSIGVTVFGTCPPKMAWRRGGGVVGDRLVVTGPLGGSLRGKHLDFTPKVREAVQWRDQFNIRAAIDISDGLALDASRLADASGCGAELILESIPIARDAEALASESGRRPVEHALGDGEDFELLLAMDAEQAARFCRQNPDAREVGALTAKRGLWARSGGDVEPLDPAGYQHR